MPEQVRKRKQTVLLFATAVFFAGYFVWLPDGTASRRPVNAAGKRTGFVSNAGETSNFRASGTAANATERKAPRVMCMIFTTPGN